MAAYPMMSQLTMQTPVQTANGGHMHPMQNVYGEMQLQQQLRQPQAQLVQAQMPQHMQQQMPQHMQQQTQQSMQGYPQNMYSPSTTQNVSVVDFKPDVLAQHQMNQLHQQYQTNTAALAARTVPNMGLIGTDGVYQPAQAAMAPMAADDRGRFHRGTRGETRGELDDDLYRTPRSRSDRHHDQYSPTRTNHTPVDRYEPRYIRPRTNVDIRSMIEENIKDNTHQTSSRPTTSDLDDRSHRFYSQSLETQRELVGDAVRTVLSRRNGGHRD
jgi:hypothetical protein